MFLKINLMKVLWDKSYFSRASQKVILKTESGVFISFTKSEIEMLYRMTLKE